MTEDELVDLEITLDEVGGAGVSLREIRALIAEARRLRKAFIEYGGHKPACPKWARVYEGYQGETAVCNCGLDEALDGK